MIKSNIKLVISGLILYSPIKTDVHATIVYDALSLRVNINCLLVRTWLSVVVVLEKTFYFYFLVAVFVIKMPWSALLAVHAGSQHKPFV